MIQIVKTQNIYSNIRRDESEINDKKKKKRSC